MNEEEKLKEVREKWIQLSNVIKFLESKGLEIKDCIFIKSRAEFVRGKILEEKLKSRYEIAIVKRFDFSSKLQRMTTKHGTWIARQNILIAIWLQPC